VKPDVAITRVTDEVARVLPRSPRLLVAVSGGRDSMVLLDALVRVGTRDLGILHVNHLLRGAASAGDLRFVRAAARRLGIPIFVARAETRAFAEERGISIELAARELRHVAFLAAAQRHGTRLVALGHHADDQIETCLFNYLRGTGTAGLSGMRERTSIQIGRTRIDLVRPLLGLRRASIEAYAQVARVRFREDESNADRAHTRNRVRHELLPRIREMFGVSSERAILRAAEILRAEHEHLDFEVSATEIAPELSTKLLASFSLALRRRIVLRWLSAFGPPGCGFDDVSAVLALADPGAGSAKINLPCGAHCRRTRGMLWIE